MSEFKKIQVNSTLKLKGMPRLFKFSKFNYP